MPKVPSWEKEAGTGLHVSAFVDDDDAEHSSSSLPASFSSTDISPRR
jgi:hypothetical protein